MTDSDPTPIQVDINPLGFNQCDGCLAGMPVDHHSYHLNVGGNIHMNCQAARYGARPSNIRSITEPLNGDEWVGVVLAHMENKKD